MGEPPAIDRTRGFTQYTCARCKTQVRVIAVRYEADPRSHFAHLFARDATGGLQSGERLLECQRCHLPVPKLPWAAFQDDLGDAWGP